MSQKFVVSFDEDGIESALEDFFDNFAEEVYDTQMGNLRDELVAAVRIRADELEEDINAGLGRPEFEKAVEDAIERLKAALRDAFAYKKKR